MTLQIRQAGIRDCVAVQDLYLLAFPEEEREAVAALAVNLLADTSTPDTFALVAEADEAVVGQICFSPVGSSNADSLLGYLLAPLAVHPGFRSRGIGGSLIEAGIEHLSQLDADIVFVYGDPGYYGKFGFDAAIASVYAPPYPLQHPFGWQARQLKDSAALPAPGKLTCVQPLQDPQLW